MRNAKRPPLVPGRRGISRLPWATNVALCIVLLIVAVAVLKDWNGLRDGAVVQDVSKARCCTRVQSQIALMPESICFVHKACRHLTSAAGGDRDMQTAA